MLKSMLWIAALGMAAGLSARDARADEAYICDGGRLVYANPETLEKLKASDPCIARYFAPEAAANVASPAPAAVELAPAVDSPRGKGQAPQLKPAMRDAAVRSKAPKLAQKAAPRATSAQALAPTVRVINAPQASPVVLRSEK